MAGMVVIGARGEVEGYRLAGATVSVATTAADVLAAWDGVPPDTAVVIVTTAAASVLGPRVGADRQRLVVVLP